MPFTFDATPGSPTANSLCDVEFADDYLAGELYADEWLSLDNGVPADLQKKQRALVKATRRLKRFDYRDGYFDTNGEVFELLRQATAELALHYLRSNPADLVEDSLRQFKHLRIAGAIEMEMRDQLPGTDTVPEHVMAMVAPFLTAGSGTVTLLRA